MAAEIGNFALILALLVCMVQAVLPLVGAHRGDMNLMMTGSYCAVSGFVLVIIAFAALTYCFATSDFSVQLVAENSQLAKPFVYKISGVWANHQGSMLLWVLILTLFASAVASFGGNLPPQLKARVLSVQGMIAVAFIAFLLFTSNPFLRLSDVPPDGNGMNPLLQDPGLVIHPPCLYTGYVGFSVAFSFAVAALIEGRVDSAWARWVRPWVLAAWCFLTMGITLGSFWAYYILGWGGWWFWDPVENVSLMPWLVGTALLHSSIVVEKRHVFVGWTILLAILTFSLSLVGTFVVRSGVLTSVHAFAVDPARGIFILGILSLTTGGALVLYALRVNTIRSAVPFGLVSRETGLAINNILLSVATFTVFVGTFYPLVIDIMGRDKISVGPPYYYLTFVPLFVVLMLVMVVGPSLRWKRDNLFDAIVRLRVPLLLAIAVAVLVVLVAGFGRVMTALGVALSFWLVAGSLWVLVMRSNAGKTSLDNSLTLLINTPRAVYGLVLAHLGLGLVVGAITIVSTWQQENILAMVPGESAKIGDYDVQLKSVNQVAGPNYDATRGDFVVTLGGGKVAELYPERRFYPVQGSQTTQTGIKTNLLSNIYIAIGEQDGQNRWTVRLYYHPAAPWLWIGGTIMALGGFVSLSDRRFRVGVPTLAPDRKIDPTSAPVAA